jgi:hypothetical protein
MDGPAAVVTERGPQSAKLGFADHPVPRRPLLMRRTEPGMHYGQITAKAADVADALLWGFHNAATGAKSVFN